MKNELLPFNLELALKNPELVVYRNGEKPLGWHWFEKAFSNFSVFSVTKNGMIEDHLIDGSFIDKVCPNEYDLMLISIPKESYLVTTFEMVEVCQ